MEGTMKSKVPRGKALTRTRNTRNKQLSHTRRSKMRIRFMSIVLGTATLCGFSSMALSQEPLPPPSTQGVRSPAARAAEAEARKNMPTTYDKHDLSGVWYGRMNSVLMGNPVPEMKPAGKKVFDSYKPSAGPRGVQIGRAHV